MSQICDFLTEIILSQKSDCQWEWRTADPHLWQGGHRRNVWRPARGGWGGWGPAPHPRPPPPPARCRPAPSGRGFSPRWAGAPAAAGSPQSGKLQGWLPSCWWQSLSQHKLCPHQGFLRNSHQNIVTLSIDKTSPTTTMITKWVRDMCDGFLWSALVCWEKRCHSWWCWRFCLWRWCGNSESFLRRSPEGIGGERYQRICLSPSNSPQAPVQLKEEIYWCWLLIFINLCCSWL